MPFAAHWWWHARWSFALFASFHANYTHFVHGIWAITLAICEVVTKFTQYSLYGIVCNRYFKFHSIFLLTYFHRPYELLSIYSWHLPNIYMSIDAQDIAQFWNLLIDNRSMDVLMPRWIIDTFIISFHSFFTHMAAFMPWTKKPFAVSQTESAMWPLCVTPNWREYLYLLTMI